MKKISLIIIVLFITSGCNKQHPDYNKNLETAKKLFQLHENEDYEAQDSLISDKLVSEASLYGSDKIGKDQFMANIKGYHMAFDNLEYIPEVWLPGSDSLGIADGSVRTYGIWTGNHVKTEKELRLKGYWYFNFDKDGKIIGQGDFFDFGGMLDAVYPKNLIINSMKIKPGMMEKALAIITSPGGLPTTKKYNGAISVEMTINDATNTIWLVYNWESYQKYAEYDNWRRTEDTVLPALLEFIDGGLDGLSVNFPNSGYQSF